MITNLTNREEKLELNLENIKYLCSLYIGILEMKITENRIQDILRKKVWGIRDELNFFKYSLIPLLEQETELEVAEVNKLVKTAPNKELIPIIYESGDYEMFLEQSLNRIHLLNKELEGVGVLASSN